MIASFLIALREGLEAALIIGVVLSYLDKVRAGSLRPAVWRGVFAAVVTSAAAAGILFTLGFQLEGRSEELFEGFTLLAAAAMLTWVILWLNGQKRTAQIEKQTAAAISQGKGTALFSVAFLAVVREGIELVLFLLAAQISSGGSQILIGAVLGLITALAAGWAIFKSVSQLDIRQFFRITNILLLLFAAGLVGYGVHELNEAGLIHPMIEEVWNINHLINDKSNIGLFLKALFGYNGNPSLTETIAYSGYILVIGTLLLKPRTRENTS